MLGAVVFASALAGCLAFCRRALRGCLARLSACAFASCAVGLLMRNLAWTGATLDKQRVVNLAEPKALALVVSPQKSVRLLTCWLPAESRHSPGLHVPPGPGQMGSQGRLAQDARQSGQCVCQRAGWANIIGGMGRPFMEAIRRPTHSSNW